MKSQLGNNRDGEHNHFDYLCTFVFHSANMDRAVRTTMQAIAEWESKTCLRFVKRTTEKEYLWFHRGNGYVGIKLRVVDRFHLKSIN